MTVILIQQFEIGELNCVHMTTINIMPFNY